jgi:catechol 2,3-dioxygenase-like lactoylglutathione lyase family enzyme
MGSYAEARWHPGNRDPHREHAARAGLLRGRARAQADLQRRPPDRLCRGGARCPPGLLKGAATKTVVLPSGTIPGHGGQGLLHVAFAIGKDELERWEAHLASRGVIIEGRNDWERGGRSIYFRDPDGHLLELATPGLWEVY